MLGQNIKTQGLFLMFNNKNFILWKCDIEFILLFTYKAQNDKYFLCLSLETYA